MRFGFHWPGMGSDIVKEEAFSEDMQEDNAEMAKLDADMKDLLEGGKNEGDGHPV